MVLYDFPNDEIKNIVWSKICKRCEKDKDCLNWSGPINSENKPYWEYVPITDYEKEHVKRRNVYIIPKLAYQLYHPDINFTNSEMVVSSCGNNLCISKDHLELISKKSQWDPEKAFAKLNDMSIRQDPIKDQNIGCLLWNGQKDKKGYGLISIFGKKYPSHLLSLLIKEQLTEVPKDNLGRRLIARHICTEKSCCEPTHLVLGTYDENNLDDKLRDGILLRGEDIQNSKLTKELVIAIKESWKPIDDPNYISIAKRAEQFGVNKGNVASIDYGVSWTHIHGNNDDIVSKLVKSRKEKQSVIRKNIRENGIIKTDYEMLKDKIYNKSIIASVTEKYVNGVPCRNWTGMIHEGYGRLQYNYVNFFTHVVICEWKNNCKKPEGMITRHLCGNKLCVEAQHLEFGTSRNNMIDALEKGDLKAKLNYESASNIRSELAKDSSKSNIEKIATQYDIAVSTINNLKNNSRWRKD